MPQRTITVQRFNPDLDPQPYAQAYELELPDHRTVLDGLLTIGDEIDPTLAFRRMCRSGICGACSGTVNGNPCLFCQVAIGDVAAHRVGDEEIHVGPLPGFRVLRDLVLDLGPFFGELERVNAWLVPDPSYMGTMPKALSQRLSEAMRCVLCGICAAHGGTEATSQVSHPAAVARVLRLANDPRDAIGASRAELLRPALPSDEFAKRLLRICPKQVDIADLLPD
jgi:succinate dehydrogenase / fumarate reductase iron-sulfur subunit